MLAFFGERELPPSLPAAAYKPNNASALFGPGPSFNGLTAVDLNYAREWRAPPKKKEQGKIRRSNSEVTVRRKSVERRKSRELSKESSASPSPTLVNGASSQSESSQDSTDHVPRYPLFVPVHGSQAQAQTRSENQSKPSGQRTRPPRRSASFSSLRKPSASERNSSPRGTGNQPRIRREKSDVLKPGNGTLRTGSAISRTSRSFSSSSLNKNSSGGVSPRSQITNPRRNTESSFGFRREKSDGVRPRRPQQTPSPRGRAQSLSSKSSSNIADLRSRSGAEMSKIPSLKRAPVATEKPQAQLSRIPSLTRQQQSPVEHARGPPKSKIPSIGKADKKSQIPVGANKSQNSSAPKASRIPSVSSAPGRPDSAKENQDPAASENGSSVEQKQEDATKSRIPSFSKKSRIPALPRKEDGGVKTTETSSPPETLEDAEDGAHNGETDHVITNGGEPPKSTKAPVSRIPSLSRPSAAKVEAKAKSNIPTPASAPAPKEPLPSGSKIPEPKPGDKGRAAPSSLPVSSKSSGIPKPGSAQSPSGIPKPNGIQSPVSVPTPAEEQVDARKTSIPQAQSRLPQLSRKESTGNAPPSKLPSLTRKTSETERSGDGGKRVAEPSKIPAGKVPKTEEPAQKAPERSEIQPDQPENVQEMEGSPENEAEPSKPQSGQSQDADESPTHKRIANEAKKVQQLLLEGEVVIEVPMEVNIEDESEMAEGKKPEELKKKPQLPTQDETLISDVLERYAPELANKENVPLLENTILGTTKVQGQNTEGRLSFDDIYVQAFENELAKAKLEATAKSKADDSVTDRGERTDKEVKKPETQTKQDSELRSPDDERKGAEVPALDTLGGYEQQSRRTRSRQRKMVSDTEESENEQSASKGESKKDLDKDKYGSSLEAEKKSKESTKPSKSKAKNEKSKFVVESSLGKEFYESKKTESKESISGLPTITKPEEEPVATESNGPALELAATSPAVETNEAVEFEDIELNSVEARQEISRSVEDLDDMTVKCMGCGRGGKCAIM